LPEATGSSLLPASAAKISHTISREFEKVEFAGFGVMVFMGGQQTTVQTTTGSSHLRDNTRIVEHRRSRCHSGQSGWAKQHAVRRVQLPITWGGNAQSWGGAFEFDAS